MSDIKYFTTTKKGDIPELREELNSSDKKIKSAALKKVIANMTMGNDMSSLFPDVLGCMQVSSLDIKKMSYLFLVSYAKAKQEMALLTINSFIRDTEDVNPLIRGLAIRTMSYIEVDKISEAMAGPLRKCLKDGDPYVRKTAALCVGKLYKHEPQLVEDEGFLDILKQMMNDPNITVLANALATLIEIDQSKEDGLGLDLDFSTTMKFMTALNESSEWGQVYILETIALCQPRDQSEAETIMERVAPRLNHANSAVIFSAIKVMMGCLHALPKEAEGTMAKRMSASLVSLLRSGFPEIQYIALRNVLLLMQKIPDLFSREMKVFFCEYNDPIYVKMAKLEVLMRIANDSNVDNILSELKEYSSEIDVDFVRKAVRAIGICAVKIEKAADRCIDVLLALIQTKVNYVVQEAIIVIKNIFRKYPNRYESIIGTLCENLDTLDEPEAKASMIWIIGQYANRIDNADELLSAFLDSFLEEATDVQLSLLTAIVKLFLYRPNSAEELIKKMFKWATEDVGNPDLRDRAFIYWRLLSTDPVGAKAVVLSEKPLSTEGAIDNIEANVLEELLGHIGSIASIYHKPPSTFLDVKRKKQNPSASTDVLPSKLLGTGNDDSLSRGASMLGQNDYLGNMGNMGSMGNMGNMGNMANMGNMGLNQASVGGGVMNLLDLDLDEPVASDSGDFGGANMGGNNLDGMLGGLSLGGGASLQGGDMGGIFSSGNSQNMYGLSLEQSLVLPKEVLLPASKAQGLEINGTFARRSGKIFLDLLFSNKAMQPMGDFAFQFNKNSFGINPAGPLQVRSPLPPNTSAETSLQLTFSAGQQTVKEPINLLQIAVKNNVGVFYFQAHIHMHILFPENGAVERSEYLRMWKEIPEANEHSTNIGGLKFPNPEAIRNKLSLNNIFAVAERQADDKTLIYCASTILPDKQVFLVELSFDAGLQSCSAAVKTHWPQFIPVLEEAITAILRS